MKVVGKIFAVLFCIIYFFILTVLMFGASALNLLSGNYYTNILESVDLDEIKISDLNGIIEGAEFEENASVEDLLDKYISESGINSEIAHKAINNKKVKAFAGNLIGQYINYNITGEKPIIVKEDFEELFQEKEVQDFLNELDNEEDVSVDKLYENLNNLIDEMIEGGNNGNTKSNSINTEIN